MALKGTAAVAGTALEMMRFWKYLLPDSMSPRAVDLFLYFIQVFLTLDLTNWLQVKKVDPLAAGKAFHQ